MGLDIAELIMNIEDGFGIELPAEIFVPLITVGDLVAYVTAQMQHQPARACYCGKAFKALRSSLMDITGMERKRFRPSTLISECIDSADECALYARLRLSLGTMAKSLPAYTSTFQKPRNVAGVPYYLSAVVVVISIGAGVVGYWWLILSCLLLHLGSRYEFRASGATGSVFRKAVFPCHMKTLGDVARYLSIDLTRDDMDGAYPIQTEIEKRICVMVANTIQMDPEKIKLTDRLVDDLGMG